MEITYNFQVTPTVEQIIELYQNSGLPRPIAEKARIQKMYDHSNLIVTAWHDDRLVGISRSITDWAWSCYLADLAIHTDYQKFGIGKKLVHLTKEKVGEETMVLLLSVPTAMDYYPKIGFTKEDRAFTILREK